MRDPKTPDELTREIFYFVGVLARSASRDRLHRAYTGIRRRERELKVARQVARQAGPSGALPYAHERLERTSEA